MLTAQPLIVSGFSSVRNSVKPAPTLPSAKYHVLLTGPVVVGEGMPVGEGIGLGDGHGVGPTVGDGVGLGVGEGVGLGVGEGVGDGVGLGVGEGVGFFERPIADDVGEGVGIGEGVRHGVGEGVLVAEGEGAGVTVLVLVGAGVGVAGSVPAGISSSRCGSLLTQTLLLPSTINPSNAPATVVITVTWLLAGFT